MKNAANKDSPFAVSPRLFCEVFPRSPKSLLRLRPRKFYGSTDRAREGFECPEEVISGEVPRAFQKNGYQEPADLTFVCSERRQGA